MYVPFVGDDGESSIVISITYAMKGNLQNVQNLVFRANYNAK